MNSITVNCPAKINLTLEIVNKREDGFHNIKSTVESVKDAVTSTKEDWNETREQLKNSAEELSYYLQGFRYEQIAEAMGKEPKAVDNALQRLKKKLKGK